MKQKRSLVVILRITRQMKILSFARSGPASCRSHDHIEAPGSRLSTPFTYWSCSAAGDTSVGTRTARRGDYVCDRACPAKGTSLFLAAHEGPIRDSTGGPSCLVALMPDMMTDTGLRTYNLISCHAYRTRATKLKSRGACSTAIKRQAFTALHRAGHPAPRGHQIGCQGRCRVQGSSSWRRPCPVACP